MKPASYFIAQIHEFVWESNRKIIRSIQNNWCGKVPASVELNNCKSDKSDIIVLETNKKNSNIYGVIILYDLLRSVQSAGSTYIVLLILKRSVIKR